MPNVARQAVTDCWNLLLPSSGSWPGRCRCPEEGWRPAVGVGVSAGPARTGSSPPDTHTHKGFLLKKNLVQHLLPRMCSVTPRLLSRLRRTPGSSGWELCRTAPACRNAEQSVEGELRVRTRQYAGVPGQKTTPTNTTVQADLPFTTAQQGL